MAKGVRTGMKWAFKPFVNVHEWIALGTLLQTFRGLFSSINDTMKPAAPGTAETFDEALARLGIPPTRVQALQRYFFKMAFLMAFLGLLAVLYVLYLLFAGFFGVSIFAFLIALIMFAYAYRYHFWYFQLKSRKLGCTFREWLNAKVIAEDEK